MQPRLQTENALARKLGVGQTTINRILRGDVNPQISTMTFIARALRVPLMTFAAVAEGRQHPDKFLKCIGDSELPVVHIHHIEAVGKFSPLD